MFTSISQNRLNHVPLCKYEIFLINVLTLLEIIFFIYLIINILFNCGYFLLVSQQIALFALVAVAFAEPEADPQYLYHHMGVPVVKPVVPVVKAAVPVVKPVVPVVRYSHPQYLYHHMGVPVAKPVAPVVKEAVPVVKPVVPVVKYVDPHHTEGMTKEGVPEKTDSVKIAEKQHELAHMYENAKKTVVPYVGYPYAYTGYYPYAQSYVPTVGHVVAKREAEGESDPYLFYNNHLSYTGYPYTSTGYTGYPY